MLRRQGVACRRSRARRRDGLRLRSRARAQARDGGRRPQALGAPVRRRQRRQHQLPPDRRLGALHADADEQGRPARRRTSASSTSTAGSSRACAAARARSCSTSRS
ncbi:MAG: hypothetical protein MZW92_42315 [Comamonadaceae bacterium]|nr:hypothetical protein [Comamonadaceae bacterium]